MGASLVVLGLWRLWSSRRRGAPVPDEAEAGAPADGSGVLAAAGPAGAPAG